MTSTLYSFRSFRGVGCFGMRFSTLFIVEMGCFWKERTFNSGVDGVGRKIKPKVENSKLARTKCQHVDCHLNF